MAHESTPVDGAAALRLLQEDARQRRTPAQLAAGLRALERFGTDTLAVLTRPRIYVIGNCSMKPLVDSLRFALLPHGMNAEIKEAAFDQWASELLDADSALYRFEPAFVIVYLSSLGLTGGGTRTDIDVGELLENGLRQLRQRCSARVLLVLPEPMEEEIDPTSPFVAWRSALVADLRRRLDEAAILVDPTPLIMDLGSANWFAARYWYHAKLPCHPNALIALGQHLATTIARCIVRPIKVIACDLDNTLWGGIVGEDGWQGLRLDPHGTGAPYIRLQAYLKDLAERGVLLVALSKNNEADVREVFEKRSEMLLKWEDFAAIRANWKTKSENLRELGETLRLDPAAFCLLDDSPFERAEVRHALPVLTVPELPVAPEDFLPFLARCGLFQIPIVTAEDRERGRYYRAETAREVSLQSSANFEDFLRTLDLRAVAEPIDDTNIERVVQLIGKTNQFNLTTRRHDIAMIHRFVEDQSAFTYCYRVLDRFGDSGLTGVLIAGCNMGSCRIDTWLLSCRVMGRTIERAMFAHLLDWLRARNVTRLEAEYLPTKKNEPTMKLLPELGFVEVARAVDGSTSYQRSTDVEYDGNSFVRLVLEASPSAKSSRNSVEAAT